MEIILVRTPTHEALYIDDVKEMEADKLDLPEVLSYLKSYFDMENVESFTFRYENKDRFEFANDYYEYLSSDNFYDRWEDNDQDDFGDLYDE